MSLRIRLIFAFFLLAVVPLAGITIYSYANSIRAVRLAAEEESAQLAQDMSGRMEGMGADLRRSEQRLRAFPFARLMHGAGPEAESQRQALMRELRSQMGDSARMVRALEFFPAPPPPDRPGMPDPGHRDSQTLVIHMSEIQAAGSLAPEAKDGASQTPVPPGVPSLPQAPPDPKSAPDAPRMQRKLSQRADRTGGIEQLKRDWALQAQKALEEAKKGLGAAWAREISAEVVGEGSGKVRAQIDPKEALLQVISRTRHRPGEIPFAVDSEGKVHTANAEEAARIQTLPMPQIADNRTAAQAIPDRNWVIAARKDTASGMTFGIARPIADRLAEIRRTAWRNLLAGLGMVTLALVGILPLSNRMTRNLRVLARGADQLAAGDLGMRVNISSRDEIGQLAAAFNRMAEDVSRHQKNLIEQERLQKELDMCRRIQEELLPREALHAGIVEVKGVSIPAREVGGDFFNYFALPNGNIALLIGDVSGKGLPAALLMANLQATIQARLPHETDLARLADQLDRQIGSATPPEAYLTLFIAILDTRSRILNYVNAGHNPQFALLADGTGRRLESTGRPLGLLPGAGYVQNQIQLGEGDSLFFYTDGLVEAESPAGEEFGMLRLEELLRTGKTSGLQLVLNQIETSARIFRNGVEASDDATMVLLRIGS